MSGKWNLDQVLALAPDEPSIKASNKLKSVSKWQLLASDEHAIWGLCKGSGSKPYQTGIDLSSTPAFKCSCPSRKFPCKHALALFQLHVTHPNDFENSAQTEWVQEWLTGRANRAESKEKKKQDQPIDAKAQAKRQQKREKRMAEGIAELSLWLKDVIREGIGELQNHDFAYWKNLMARMVDAQTPGLANWIETLHQQVRSGQQWEDRTMTVVGKLHLLLQAAGRLEQLDGATQEDIKQNLGLQPSKESVLQNEGVFDIWKVLALRQSKEGNLVAQRIYLQGEQTQKQALILEFAHSTQVSTLTLGWTAPRRFEGALHFYPGVFPYRCLAGTCTEVLPFDSIESTSLEQGLEQWKSALIKNPWLLRFPIAIGQVRIVPGTPPKVVDADGRFFVLHKDFKALMQLLAVAGPNPVSLFGEYDGWSFFPLGVEADGHYWELNNG